MARMAGHTLSGQALMAMDRLNDAKEELDLAERETERLPPQSLAVLPYPGALRAEILLREKNTEEGEALTADIEKLILAAPGPDAWSAALFELESIAQTARQLGDWGLAEATARELIQHNSSYAGGYFALGLVAEHAGDARASAASRAGRRRTRRRSRATAASTRASRRRGCGRAGAAAPCHRREAVE